ncbi:MAG: hypothetical protein KAJ19_13295 [Gammaproteobacteria bacterium]|nr:hypothetical protein [Gammaproteobacteria bacterium]
MAVDFISINTASADATYANALVSAVRQSNNIRAQLTEMKEKSEEMIDGASYVEMELRFGLAADEGTTVYNLLVGALVAMDGASVQQFCARLG